MSNILRLHHGPFGHLSVVELTGALVEHAHSTPSVGFWISGSATSIRVSDSTQGRGMRRAILINSFVPHSVEVEFDGRPARCLVFYLSSEWLMRILRTDVQPDFDWLDLPISRISHQRLLELADMLCSPFADELELDAEITDFLRNVLMGAQSNGENQRVERRRPRDFRVRRAIAFMRDNLPAGLGMQTLARASGISRPHLFAVFKAQLDITPRLFWNALRLESAKAQMWCSNESLNHIANRLGFNAPGNFTRFFKQHTGVAPREYRSTLGTGSPAVHRGRRGDVPYGCYIPPHSKFRPELPKSFAVLPGLAEREVFRD